MRRRVHNHWPGGLAADGARELASPGLRTYIVIVAAADDAPDDELHFCSLTGAQHWARERVNEMEAFAPGRRWHATIVRGRWRAPDRSELSAWKMESGWSARHIRAAAG
jgi:hypothetical protein